MARILWTDTAIKDLEKIDKVIARRILKRISWYANNFTNIVPEPLSGTFKGMFKLRIGDWRVVYAIEEDALVIYFVGHRREIYKA